jgi:hypothetical protein
MPALIKGKQIEADTITAANVDETGTLSTINAGDAAVDGAATGLANKAHQHAVATAAPGATTVSAGSPAEGSAANLMRSDASLQADVSGTLDSLAVGASGSDGSGDGLALKTHEHAVPAATAIELTDSTNSAGDNGSFVHANHEHAHGSRGGGTLHSAATTGTAGFMSSADKAKLDNILAAELQDFKSNIRLLATGNVTLSGNQTVDGVGVATGDRVMCLQQSTSTQDGLYVVDTGGAWARAVDMPAASGAAGAFFTAEEGTSNADTTWVITNNEGSDVVGTDDLAAQQIGAGSPRGAGAGLVLNGNDLDVANADGSITVNADNILVGILQTDAQHGVRGGGTQHADVVAAGADGFMTGSDKTKLDGITAGAEPNLTENAEELTTEAITGTDTALTDTLTNTPDDWTKVEAYLNGIKQIYGAGNDFTGTGTTLTWLASTGTAVDMETTDSLEVVYMS